MSRVDVIIPCYKYAHFLPSCVKSVLEQQPGVDVRVFIIDDCSPDNPEEVGRALAAADCRIEYRRHAVNRRHIATYNEGLEWASGDYVLLLSADDLMTPGSLTRAAKVMDAHPRVALTYGRDIQTNDPARHAKDMVGDDRDYPVNVMTGQEFWEKSCEHAGNLVSTPTAIARTSVQKVIGGYNASLPHTGDMEMWLRFAAHGDVAHIDAHQAFYRVHGQNMSVGYVGLGDLEQRLAAFSAAIDAHGHRLLDSARLRATFNRCVARDAFWAGSLAFDAGDVEACRRYHAFAFERHPQLRRSAACWRFRGKRLLGRHAWSTLRLMASRFRGGASGTNGKSLGAAAV